MFWWDGRRYRIPEECSKRPGGPWNRTGDEPAPQASPPGCGCLGGDGDHLSWTSLVSWRCQRFGDEKFGSEVLVSDADGDVG